MLIAGVARKLANDVAVRIVMKVLKQHPQRAHLLTVCQRDLRHLVSICEQV